MHPDQLRPYVDRLFAPYTSGTAVAVEHELLVADATTGGTVPVARVRRAVGRTRWASYVSFEPGGQLELSLPPSADPTRIGRTLRTAVRDLRRRLWSHGVRLVSLPFDPRPQVPLQLEKPRYLAMQRHFDTIGPAGRRMMRRTASSQICLDWWPGSAGLEQWRVLHLTAPFLAAAFARGSGPAGRLATWLAVDPTRTAYDDRLLHGDDPEAAYADFAARATCFMRGGAADHLTTLFPPVRPRGRYLEIRYVDAQPVPEVGRVAAALADLVYDDDRRRTTLARLAPEQERLADQWRAAAAGDAATAARGWDLLGDAREAAA